MSFKYYLKGLANGAHADTYTVMAICGGCVALCGVHLTRMLVANPDSRVHITHRMDEVPEHKQVSEGENYRTHPVRRFLIDYFQDKPLSMMPQMHRSNGTAFNVEPISPIPKQ